MSGSPYSMLYRSSIVSRRRWARLAFIVLFWAAWIPQAVSQTSGPPADISAIARLPARDPNAIAVDGWLLYPTVRLYSLYSDNFFQTPTTPLSVGALGVTPSLTAVWSNGIHTTTLYGNLDRQDFPTDNGINTLDSRAGFTQRYEAMRDLIFTVNGNYAQTAGLTQIDGTLVLGTGNSFTLSGGVLKGTGNITGNIINTGGTVAPGDSPGQLTVGPITAGCRPSRTTAPTPRPAT